MTVTGNAQSTSEGGATSQTTTAGAQSSLRQGILLNWGSLVFLGLSGIALNVVVSRFYDNATLGVFNEVLAAYVVLSMAGSGGLHLSALRSIAAAPRSAEHLAPIMLGAFLPALALASVVAGLAYLLAPVFGQILESPPAALGLRVITPGLFFFALNKTLFSVVNGLERMRAYALYQSLRYLLILTGLGLSVTVHVDSAMLPGIFSFAESLLFVVLLADVSSQVPWWSRWNPAKAWSSVHLRYGAKAVLSGLLLELNSRVDVLMIGYFMSDDRVGVYSYAVLFAEGFLQLIVVLQNSYNPLLAKALAKQDLTALSTLTRKARRWIYPAVGVLGLISIPAYPLVLLALTGQRTLGEVSQTPYAVLVCGIMATAGYLPFLNVLSMGNRPGWHSLLMASFVVVNVIANAILIPRLGISGAALGTATTFVTGTLLLLYLARAKLGVRL